MCLKKVEKLLKRQRCFSDVGLAVFYLLNKSVCDMTYPAEKNIFQHDIEYAALLSINASFLFANFS